MSFYSFKISCQEANPARMLAIVILMSLAFSLTGCSVFNRPAVVKKDYSLTVKNTSTKKSENAPPLAVRYFESASLFDNDFFVYRTGEGEWESDYYNVFAGSPTSLLTTEVRNWLDQSGVFSEAGIPGLAPRGSWRLQGYVEKLYGDFRDPASPAAVLAIRFALYPPHSEHGSTPVYEKSISSRNPFSQRTPEALVEAWNQSLKTIMTQLDTELAPVVRNFKKPEASSPASAPSGTGPPKTSAR